LGTWHADENTGGDYEDNGENKNKAQKGEPEKK
jgi:hypothetical protein